MDKKMTIDIWSDIACPFCYIGLNKLGAALECFEHRDQVELKWHSYSLDANLPMQALDISFIQYLAEAKDVSEGEIMDDLQGLIAAGQGVNIHFNFEKLVIANTSLALSLVKIANESGLATAAEAALFAAYFEQGKDISDMAVLANIADDLGLDKNEAIAMLTSGKYAQSVIDDTAYADDVLNLNFIPYFLFNKEHAIQGAVTLEDYQTTLQKSFSEWSQRGQSAQVGDTISGQSCSIDGVCS